VKSLILVKSLFANHRVLFAFLVVLQCIASFEHGFAKADVVFGDSIGGTGLNQSANGANAISIGQNASSIGASSMAIGALASSNGISAIAIGSNANASSASSIAIGIQASAQNNGLSIGVCSQASASQAIAVGANAQAIAINATAIASNAFAPISNFATLHFESESGRVLSLFSRTLSFVKFVNQHISLGILDTLFLNKLKSVTDVC
jgi:hypothetical protein